MTEIETFPDYAPWLDQVDAWPRLGEEGKSIWGMAPGHAISAYRKLLRWAERQPTMAHAATTVRRTPLAMALLHQAVGTEVLYAADLPPAPLAGTPHPMSDVALEAVYDAIAELEAAEVAAGKKLHILSRTRLVHKALTTKEDAAHVG